MPFINKTFAPFQSSVDGSSYQTILQKCVADGWIVESEGPSGAQLRKLKAMSLGQKTLMVIGFFGLFIYGIGILLILAVIVEFTVFTKAPRHFLFKDTPRLP